jgi:type I restriction enzyme S subunit
MDMNDLPKGWQWKKLGDICLTKGQYGSCAKKVNFDGKVRYIRITDIDDRGILNQESVSPSTIEEYYFLEENDLLFARSGSVGRTYLHKKKDGLKYQYAGYLIRFKINTAIAIPEFVYYMTNSLNYFEWVELIKKSGTISNINAKEFASYELPVPPLKTQKEIITILKRVESLKQKREVANEDTNTIIQSLFYEMFGDPINNEKGWDEVNLNQLCKQIQTGFAYGNFDKNEGVPHLRPYNITESGKLDLTQIKYTSEDAIKNDKYKLINGDVILNTTNSGNLVGKTVLFDADIEASFSNHMTKLRVFENKMKPVFLATILQIFFKNGQFKPILKRWVNQVAIDTSKLKNISLIVPPIELQKQFAEMVKKIESLKEKQKQSTGDINTLFDALIQNAFNGKLVN